MMLKLERVLALALAPVQQSGWRMTTAAAAATTDHSHCHYLNRNPRRRRDREWERPCRPAKYLEAALWDQRAGAVSVKMAKQIQMSLDVDASREETWWLL